VQTTIAAIYIKVTSMAVAEIEVSELLRHLADNGCRLATEGAVIDDDDYDELDSLRRWAGTKDLNMICLRRTVSLEDRDEYLSFVKNLYSGNVTLLGLKGD
jgi:hypothetical protein